jgi:hypothetical protein
MWQNVDGKYHWVLSADRLLVADGQQAMTYCRQAVTVQRADQVPYIREGCCEFCNGVSNIIHTAAYEAIRYSVPKETSVDVLRRALEFTSTVTLRKAIERKIRKLEGVQS